MTLPSQTPPHAPEGASRRDWLKRSGRALAAATASAAIPPALPAADRRKARSAAPAKSVIVFNLLGGPSQLDMFDLKPDAPSEVRGEFRSIDTSLPGLSICEHLPNTSRWMHRATLIRTVTHGYNAHNPLPVLTGFAGGNFAQLRAEPTDPPDIGAVCQYLGLGTPELPGAVCLPCYPGWGESSMYPGIRRPGPYGGFLGSQYDPLFSVCEPKFDREPTVAYYDPVLPIGEPKLPSLAETPDLTLHRLERRKQVLEQLDAAFATPRGSKALDRMHHFQRRAFDILISPKTREAFDLSKEPDAVRDRYGRHLSGASLLVARRLVEAGVPFISVHAEIFGRYGHSYDTHENNFGMLKNSNLPILDQSWPALMQDLEQRGLLDSTLVVVMGEMGRTARINGKAGRDHWPQCGFSLLAGGGLRQGVVYGESDGQAQWPKSFPVTPADLVTTIYHQLGIDPHTTVPDRTGRPMPISHGGEVLRDIIV